MKKGHLVFLFVLFLLLAGCLIRGVRTDQIAFTFGADDSSVESDEGALITGYFLTSPFGTQQSIETFIEETRYELVGRQYQVTEGDIIALLQGLSHLGRRIQLVLENDTYGEGSKEYDAFVKKTAGSPLMIKSDEGLGTNFVHAKTLVRDRQTVLIASANLSYPSFRRNREYRFVTENSSIAENLLFLFVRDIHEEQIGQDDIHPALLFCPIDCRSKLLQALDSATERIVMSMQYVEDPEIISLLEKKYHEGVELQLLLGEYQDKEAVAGLSGTVRIFKENYLHTKSILVDDTTLLHGSANLSTNALDNNREIGIILHDPVLIRTFSRQFERDRSVGVLFSEAW